MARGHSALRCCGYNSANTVVESLLQTSPSDFSAFTLSFSEELLDVIDHTMRGFECV